MDVQIDPEDLPYKLIRKLLPKNPLEEFTLLLFFDQPRLFPSPDIQNIVVEELQKRYYIFQNDFFLNKTNNFTKKVKFRNVQNNPQKFSLWGGDILAKTGSKFTYFDTHLWFGMCISGPGIESWSTIVDFSWSNSKIREKIDAFKKVVKVDSSKTVAMAMQTTDDLKKIKIFSEAFPEVDLLTLGVKEGIPKYCMDSNSQCK